MLDTLAQVQAKLGSSAPEVAVILGSGLGGIRKHLKNLSTIPYYCLPALPKQNITGHHAELLIGELFGRKTLLFCGRFHVYQGLSCFDSTVTIRLAAALGCKAVLLTCAVGGIDKKLKTGDFLLVKDHLNFTGLNPLQGIEPPSFVDMHDAYRHHFLPSLQEEAFRMQRRIHAGVLAYMVGPSYETPAEIDALRALGASAVSMSTVPETIMARALGLSVSALALVTNLAGGSATEKLSHQEVLACSDTATDSFSRLVECLLSEFLPE